MYVYFMGVVIILKFVRVTLKVIHPNHHEYHMEKDYGHEEKLGVYVIELIFFLPLLVHNHVQYVSLEVY